jgi:hypothetical protein
LASVSSTIIRNNHQRFQSPPPPAFPDNRIRIMKEEIEGIIFRDYVDESQLDSVMSLVGRDLSEPYSSKSALYYHTMRPWSVTFVLDEHIQSHALTSFVVSIHISIFS